MGPAVPTRAGAGRRPSGVPPLAIALALFTLSGGVLWHFGVNYTGLTGSPIDKIHPATYACVLTLMWRCAVSGNPVAYLARVGGARPATVLLAAVALALFVQVVLTGQHNMAGTIDSYLLPSMLVLLFVDIDAPTRRRLEILMHGVLIVNAALGLVEFAIHDQFFPFRLDGKPFVNETRSAALQGHPLESATVTALYTLALICGAGRALGPRLRAGVIVLEFAALIAFGGRSAIIVTLALGGAAIARALHRGLRRGRVSLPGLAAGVLFALAGAVAVAGLSAGGFFDAILTRFASDGGSAQARVAMFDLFGRLQWRDFITGPDTSYVDSLRLTLGLEWGIENPIVYFVLYHGALFTLLMIAAIALFVAEVVRGLGPGKAMPVLAFLMLINTYEGIASKSLVLAKFLVLMTALYPPAAVVATAMPRPAPLPAVGNRESFAGP